jgi:threonine synthase
MYEETGYISDPHSAAGYLASRQAGEPGFWLSTAHAAKFGEVIVDALGRGPVIPDALQASMNQTRVFESMPADAEALASYLTEMA